MPSPTSQATYSVQVGWDATPSTPFIIGSSTLGGGDLLTSPFSVTFGGTYDELIGMAGYGVKSINITRGRGDAVGAVSAGECTITLHDPDGRFNPSNPASVLAGKLLPMRQLRVRGTNDGVGTQYTIFRGFIRSIEHDPTLGVQETIINAVDLFLWLSRVNPIIESISPNTTGEAIRAILTEVGWVISSLVDTQEGDELATFSADGTTDALSLIAGLLETERGVFYIKGDGTANYINRHERSLQSSQATFTTTMTAAKFGVDLDRIANRVRVTRDGGEQQVANNATSQSIYGTADLSEINSPYLVDDAQALSLANYLASTLGDGRSPVWTFSLMNSSASAMTQMLVRELGDRITVNAPLGGTAGDYYIESISHVIEEGGKYHHFSAALSERTDGEVFVIGSSALGAGDILTF